MVVLSLQAMILLAALFQSIKFIQGLKCYQCEHPGSIFLDNPCDSFSCDDDPFHSKIKKRLKKVSESLRQEYRDMNDLQLQEQCYMRIMRPIPFNGHERGCFVGLKIRNVSVNSEFDNFPTYEEWLLCDTNNCNDMGLPGKRSLAEAQRELQNHSPSLHSSTLALSYLLTTALLILVINYFHCSYYFRVE